MASCGQYGGAPASPEALLVDSHGVPGPEAVGGRPSVGSARGAVVASSRHAVVVVLDDETPATSCHLESEVSFASEDEGLLLGGGARSVVDM